MKREIEEIIISIDDKGDKVVFKRLKKSGSMEKMSMEKLREIVCSDAVHFTHFWRWLLLNAHSHFCEDALLENWLEEKLDERRVKYGNIE